MVISKKAFALFGLMTVLVVAAQGFALDSSSLVMGSFSVESTGQAVKVETGLTLKNSGEVKAQLRDGAQMMLTCKTRLERLRTLLSNVALAETTRVFYLRHDPLLREFMVFEGTQSPQRHKNLDMLLTSAWTSLHIVLPLKEPLEPGETYRITVTAALQHAKVPPWLEHALFFWSWDVVPSITFTQEFTF